MVLIFSDKAHFLPDNNILCEVTTGNNYINVTCDFFTDTDITGYQAILQSSCVSSVNTLMVKQFDIRVVTHL